MRRRASDRPGLLASGARCQTRHPELPAKDNTAWLAAAAATTNTEQQPTCSSASTRTTSRFANIWIEMARARDKRVHGRATAAAAAATNAPAPQRQTGAPARAGRTRRHPTLTRCRRPLPRPKIQRPCTAWTTCPAAAPGSSSTYQPRTIHHVSESRQGTPKDARNRARNALFPVERISLARSGAQDLQLTNHAPASRALQNQASTA